MGYQSEIRDRRRWPRRSRRLWRAVVVVTVALAAAPESGAAGEYPINLCAADSRRSTEAFTGDFSLRGMRAAVNCQATDRGLAGVVTANSARGGEPVSRGRAAAYVIKLPRGLHFVRARWAGAAQRRDCRYAMSVYAIGPGGARSIFNKPANVDCRPEARAGAFQKVVDIGGTTKVVQRTICVGKPGRPRCSNRSLNALRTFRMRLAVAEDGPQGPALAVVQDSPFAQGQWVGASDQPVTYTAQDLAGVKQVRALVGGQEAGRHERDCRYSALVPCPNGPGTITVRTATLAEGTQELTLAGLDSADNLGHSPSAVTVRVDRTAPGAVAVAVAGGEGWRNANNFDLGWTNPDEGDRAPITAANYRLCPVSGGECVPGSREGPGISGVAGLRVPGEGEWRLSMWRSDAAGNQQPANASEAVVLRFDGSPPELGFESTSAEDPTLLAVQVNDRVSGLAGGQIEISREGSGAWQQLATAVEAKRLVARVDDASLPAGTYRVRAFAHDQANNQASTDRRLDGQPMTIRVPLRIATALRAGVERKRWVKRRVKRGGKQRMVRRRVTVLRSRARVAFGRRVNVAGRLTNSDGQPLAGAALAVYSRTEISPEQLVGTVTTGPRGRWRYRARGSTTRTLRIVYRGTAQILPAQREVALLVPAASSIRVTPRRTRNGRTVRFRGRLRAPAADKLVELQARVRGRWRTFRTMRSGPNGVWKARYRFEATCRLQRYRFRARLPRQAGYPYETGHTRRVAVLVSGNRCP